MNHSYILDFPSPTDPHENTERSNFLAPSLIQMGEEGSEYLESIIQEQTGELVIADEDWTRLSGMRSIDTSVVGGFMFQSDAGTGCSVQVTENGKLPVRILIDQEQDSIMFLVAVQRHEEWTTSGGFHLRFLRRVPVSDGRCTARLPNGVPVEPPSDSSTSGVEEPGSTTADTMSFEEEEDDDADTMSFEEEEDDDADTMSFEEEEEDDDADDENEMSDRATSTSNSPSGDTCLGPPGVETQQNSEDDEDMTDVEDHRGIGAAALRRIWGGVMQPGESPPSS